LVNTKIIIALKKSKAPVHIQQSLDIILRELEDYGRAITDNGSASRFLAHRFKTPKNNGHIYFGWNKQYQKSMIVLKTGVKLERVSDNKVRIISEKDIDLKPQRRQFR